MKTETRQIITGALLLDTTVSVPHRQTILAAVDQDGHLRETISEREAARILRIAHTSMGRWRRGIYRSDTPFPFRVVAPPGGRIQYYRDEIEAWARKNYGAFKC